MPRYSFQALDLNNKRVTGVEEAKDENDLRHILRLKSLVPVRFSVIEEQDIGYKLKPNECAEFSRQLASMLSSGITAVRALELIRDSQERAAIRNIVTKLHKDVSQGMTISEAMRLQKRAFPNLLINMYGSGEASGQLELVATKMAFHYDKEHKLNGKVKSAMMYPMILAVITVLVVLLIFIAIIPEFIGTLVDMGVELPLITRIVMGLSDFLVGYWYIPLVGVVLLVALFTYLLTVPKIRLAFDQFKLKVPILGKLLSIIYTARFSRTLASLYTSGISMINALEITVTIIGNKFIEGQFDEVIQDIRNGEPLSVSTAKVKGMNRKLPSMMLIGEESGRLDTMLESTAEIFDYDAEMATGRLVQLVEPIMLIIMAVVIGVVMMSVLMPTFAMYSNAGNM